MQIRRNGRRRLIRAATATLSVVAIGPATAWGLSPVDTMADGVSGSGYETVALLSVGETVPRTRDSGQSYRMVGLPDGLGAIATGTGSSVYMSHEFTQSVTSNPVVDGKTYRGAIASRFKLDTEGNVVSGDLAFTKVYQNDTFVGSIATTTNGTPAFARFCSGSLAGPAEGFSQPIYFANEETDGPASFDPGGAQTVAIYNGQAHALSAMGRFSKENTLVWPNDGSRTAVMLMEDGPTTPDSQLWMYVGRKDPPAGSVLGANGLLGGKLYVYVGTEGANSEAEVASGSVFGHWVHIPQARSMTDVELEAAADAAGAFSFVRIEDGAFATTNRNDFYFVTTGGNAEAGNELGRAYHLRLNPQNILNPARLDVVYNADTVVGDPLAPTGDIALSPDNIDTNGDSLVIQEDGTSQSRAVFGLLGREAAIWRFDLEVGVRTRVDASSATRIAELTPPGQDGIPVPIPGTWETSGIIDTADLFGAGSWLFDVQAHAPTTAPVPGTVEDGQLLLLRPALT